MKTLALAAAAASLLAFASAGQAAPYANCYLHVAGNPNIPCPAYTDTMTTPHYRVMPRVVVDERAPLVTGAIPLNQPHFHPIRRPVVAIAGRRSECRPGEYWTMNEPGGSGDTAMLMRCPG